MSALGAALRRFLACCGSDAPRRRAGPAPEPAAEPWHGPNPFGPTLTELRAALACFDLVDAVARADGDGTTAGDRLAHAYAGWALAAAAQHAVEAYAAQLGPVAGADRDGGVADAG